MKKQVAAQLSEKEKQDLTRLETQFRDGYLQAIDALMEIRERKLYREKYTNFGDYMEREWRHTKQWATQQINRRKVQRALEAAGRDLYSLPLPDKLVEQLPLADATILMPLVSKPEKLVAAALAGQSATGKARTNAVRKAVRQSLTPAQRKTYDQRGKRPASPPSAAVASVDRPFVVQLAAVNHARTACGIGTAPKKLVDFLQRLGVKVVSV